MKARVGQAWSDRRRAPDQRSQTHTRPCHGTILAMITTGGTGAEAPGGSWLNLLVKHGWGEEKTKEQV